MYFIASWIVTLTAELKITNTHINLLTRQYRIFQSLVGCYTNSRVKDVVEGLAQVLQVFRLPAKGILFL